MKRLIVVFTMILLLIATAVQAAPAQSSVAVAVKPTLSSAKIDIKTNGDGVYTVRQNVNIIGARGIKDGKVELLIAKINGIKMDKLTIKVESKTIPVNIQTATALDKIHFQMPTASEQLNYIAEYSVTVPKDLFTVPLLLPLYPSTGKELCVVIDYVGPQGTFIQENSFPEIHSPKGNSIESALANIPSHVSYVYSSSPSSFFNSYNMISVAVFIVLMLIIVKWIRTEIFKK